MADRCIQVENLWKQYRLGVVSHRRLAKDLQSWWARQRGQEDPNSRVLSGASRSNRTEGDDWFWALKDVSFEAREGEVIGIIGRNGAGKSTLLKILSRVTTPTKGQISITGRVASLLEVGTGFHPELTGRENVFLNGAILGMSKAEIHRKFDEIVSFSEVEKFIDTPVKRYSSGMYVRLAFGVAAHLEPEILIVDEVLAVGDMAFQRKCLGKMEAVGKEGRTVLFVSHNMPSVQKLCSRAILLDRGTISQSGTVPETVNSYLGMGVPDALHWERSSTNRLPTAYFLKINVTDPAGNRLHTVSTSDQLLVRIEIVITEPSTLYRISVVLMDEMGTRIFSTSPHDLGLELPSEPGVHVVSVLFPQHILMPRRYKIKAHLGKKFEKSFDSVETLGFIPQEAISAITLTQRDRNDLISLNCDWTVG